MPERNESMEQYTTWETPRKTDGEDKTDEKLELVNQDEEEQGREPALDETETNSIIEKMNNVFWSKINENDSLYKKSRDVISTLCTKYDIQYNNDADSIYKNVLAEINEDNDAEKIDFQNGEEVKKLLESDLNKCTSIDMISSVEMKYKHILNQYGDYISEYTSSSSSGKLFGLMNGGIEKKHEQIDKLKEWQAGEKPKVITERDEDVWPIEDENGNEVTRLETDEEVRQRIIDFQKRLEEHLKSIGEDKVWLRKWMEYLIILPKLSGIYEQIKSGMTVISESKNEMVLNDFRENEQFMSDLARIMDHNTEEYEYLYHGTKSIEDAEKIMSDGLYMASDRLDSTTYSEFTSEQLLLYSRGFGGEIGADAIVIIKKPKDGQIVAELTSENKKSVSVFQSGLGGFTGMEYVIPKDYIVGYVNKRDKRVVEAG
jgi:hypothetical protein